MTYSFNVPNGGYTVKLHFAEIYSGAFKVGGRVFNVSINGTQVLTNYDIYADVGANTATIKSFTTNVSNGVLAITFGHVVEDPKISAIEILSNSDTTPPSVPTSLGGTAASSSAVDLAWNASTDTGGSGLAGYKIYRNSALVGTTASLIYTDTGLSPSTTYQYSVSAYDNANNESAQSSPPVSVTTQASTDTTPPSVPTNLNGTANGTAEADLTWSASTDTGGSGLAGYKIYRNNVQVGTTAATSFADTGLAAGTTYTYTVSAYDNATNESAKSSPKNVTTATATGTVIRVNAGGPAYTDSAAHTWSADTGYNTGNAASTTSNIAGTSDPTLYKTERWDTSALPEMTYSFNVPNGGYTVKLHFAEIYSGAFKVGGRVFNVSINGTQVLTNYDIYADVGANTATIKSFTTNVSNGVLAITFGHVVEDPKISAIEIIGSTDSTAPTVPTGLAGSAASSTQVNLSWNASTDSGGSGLAGYRVYRNNVLVGTATGTTYSDTGLTPNTTYNYAVSAFDNANNESAKTASIPVTTPAGSDTIPPSVPTNLQGSGISPSQISLTWSASTDTGGSGLAGYRIYRNNVLVGTSTTTSFTDSGLASGTTYQYKVSAYDNAANESAAAGPIGVATLTSGGGGGTTVRVNAGGGSYVDSQGHTWSADTGFNTGQAATIVSSISGTADPTLFYTQRWDPSSAPELAYTFSVANGSYTVNLYFAETYSGTFGVGKRLFNVFLQGQQVLSNFDVYAAAGGPNTAVVRSFPVNVTNGQIVVSFGHVKEDPEINAIEIVGSAVAAPTFSPNGGTITSSTPISMSTTTSGATIHYTTDGTNPTTSSPTYTSPITLGSSATVKAAAFTSGSESTVTSASFSVVSLPVSYDFSTSDTSAWQIVDDTANASSWAVVSGAYRQSVYIEQTETGNPYVGTYRIGSYAYLKTTQGLSDYEAAVDITPRPDVTNIFGRVDDGFMFRYQDDNDYYRISLSDRDGYTRLEKRVGGTFTTLAVNARGWQPNQTVHLLVRVKGPIIQVFQNGASLFAVRDTSLATGTVALYTQDRSVDFDNVVVSNVSGSPSIVIGKPLAYSVQTGTALTVTALTTNVPPGSTVQIYYGSTACGAATMTQTDVYSASCGTLPVGDYTIQAQLVNGTVLATDTRSHVGVGGDNYITVGDSITAGHYDNLHRDNLSADGRIIASQGYEANLDDLLAARLSRPVIIFNNGIGGDKSSDAANTRIASILERQPGSTKTLIMLGTNDSRGSIPVPSGLGCTGSGCNGTFAGNMQHLVDQLTAAGKAVYVAQTLPAFASGSSTYTDPYNTSRNQLIRDYNTVIRTQLSGITLGPDFNTYFLTSTLSRPSFFTDGEHPNGLGYTIMAQLWEDALTGDTTQPFILQNLCNRLLSSTCSAPVKTDHKQNLLETGDAYYTDAAYTLTTIPSALQNGIWIMTANAEKSSNAAAYIDFTLDRPATVYVAYDAAHATTLPSWLGTFTSAGTSVTTTNPNAGTLALYSRSYTAGPVSLPANLAGGGVGAQGNFVVIVVPN